MEQMKLLDTPRVRVRLGGPDSVTRPRPEHDTAAFARARVRLDRPVDAEEVTPRSADFQDRMLCDAIGYPPWESKGAPPCVGLWEVTDHKTGTLLARWWFGGVWWLKTSDPNERNPIMLSHWKFEENYAWRGLRAPSTDIYPCPPYSSKDLADRALAFGVGIRTTHIKMTRPEETGGRVAVATASGVDLRSVLPPARPRNRL